VISAKSKHQDVAAAFLDFFISEEITDYLYMEGWGIPGATLSSTDLATGPTSASILKMLDEIRSGPGTTPFLDWAAPSFGTDLPTNLQALGTGEITPEEYTKKIQAEWSEFQQQRKSS
jgi:raffinose/stachyose/melibiose transport system substrate-binding protein